MILSPSDFVGFYALSQQSKSLTKLNAVIADCQTLTLDDLLGCELAALYLADLDVDNVPQTQRFTDIHDAFCEYDECDIRYKSEGIKEMLKGFTYFKYAPLQEVRHAGHGFEVLQGENASKPSGARVADEVGERYNRAVASYQAIQWKICNDPTTYPEYDNKGQEKRFIFFGGAF